MVIKTDFMVSVVGSPPSAMIELSIHDKITGPEAEGLIKQLQDCIANIRKSNKPRTKIGDYGDTGFV